MNLEKPKRVYGLGDAMPFGKYKGRYVADLLKSDPEYMIWALVNMDLVEFSTETCQAIHAYIAADPTGKRKKRFDVMRKKKAETKVEVLQKVDDDDEEIIDLEAKPVPKDAAARYVEWGAF